MSDKQALLEQIKEEYPSVIDTIEENGGECWTTDELTEEFDVQSFMAPFCVAIKRETNEKGTLLFLHMPRIYYRWIPA